jgi:hypothetical protein
MDDITRYDDNEFAIALATVAHVEHFDGPVLMYVQEAIRRLKMHCPGNLDTYRTLYERSGKIAAIKEYRNRMGTGLKDSKEGIEYLARVHGWEPYPYHNAP